MDLSFFSYSKIGFIYSKTTNLIYAVEQHNKVIPIMQVDTKIERSKVFRKSSLSSLVEVIFVLTSKNTITIISNLEKKNLQFFEVGFDKQEETSIVDFQPFEENKLMVLGSNSSLLIFVFNLKKKVYDIIKEIEIDAGFNSKPYLLNLSDDFSYLGLMFSTKIKNKEQNRKKLLLNNENKLEDQTRNSILLFEIVNGYNLNVIDSLKIRKTQNTFLDLRLLFDKKSKRILAFDNEKPYAWKLQPNGKLAKLKNKDHDKHIGTGKYSFGHDFKGKNLTWWIDGNCKINWIVEE